MLSSKQIAQLREELQTAKNPLFIHDDDADGLCSYLLLYKMHREGKEFILKSSPKLDEGFVKRIQEYDCDKIFILDVPIVEQEFIDQVNKPMFWLDHHQPLERKNIQYFNPRVHQPDSYFPTTYLAWQVSQNQEDLWIAMIGCLADHHLPDFVDEFQQRYPGLMHEKKDLARIVYHDPVGKLVKLIFFLLKGPTSDVRSSIKTLLKVQAPDEILHQTTPAGKFVYKRFQSINRRYESLLDQAKKRAGKDPIFLFIYTEQQWSFTAELSNEVAALFPDKIVLIGRRKSGEMKCSLRAPYPVVEILQKALVGINGYGGGHPQACGVVVKEEDWEQFLLNFRRELKL